MSLFDPPRPYLNPVIWTADEQVKPEAKTYIMNLLTKIFPLEKVYQMAM
jgi:hypothetical protein